MSDRTKPSPEGADDASGSTTDQDATDGATDGGGRSRRWFLIGGAAAVLGGAGGVGAQLLHHPAKAKAKPPPTPPRQLVEALAAEDALVADLDATTGGAPAVRRVIAQARADHVAHAGALRSLIAGHPQPTKNSATPSSTAPTGSPRTRAQLRAAEQRASAQAVGRATAAHGELATLFASIAACEATHAELLG